MFDNFEYINKNKSKKKKKFLIILFTKFSNLYLYSLKTIYTKYEESISSHLWQYLKKIC